MGLFSMLIGDDKPKVVKEVVEKNGNKKEEKKDVPFIQINGHTTKKGVTLVTIGDGPTLALTMKKTEMAISVDEFKYIDEMIGGLDAKKDLVWAEAQKVKVEGEEFMSLKEGGDKYEYDDRKVTTFNVGKKIDPTKPTKTKSKPAKPSTS